MEPIEGITPQALWTALYVLVAVCGLIVLWDKVRAVFAGVRERKQAKRPELADEISDKVLKKLEPRFADIDRKLANDKARIDDHTRAIDALSRRTDGLETGQRALCRGVMALLNFNLHNGNTDEMEKANNGINDYLIQK
jgi:hypothetical protein